MTPRVQAAVRAFEKIILDGVPWLLKQNETAFLSFMTCVAAIDALAAYRFSSDNVGARFKDFITDYFPSSYHPHAANLYLFRCRMLHNFSPAYFTVVHGQRHLHLTRSQINDPILSDEVFFADLESAARIFFTEVASNPSREAAMDARLGNLSSGGAIYGA